MHLWGQVCDVDALQAIAERHRLKLLFDAAHAFGCRTPQGRVGGFGELEVFSFHATKFVNSLEGGAVVTNDDEIARQVRLMRNFGFLGYDNVGSIGTNGKLNEFNAAMGLASIAQVEELIDVNRRNHAAYQRALTQLPGLTLMDYSDLARHNYQYLLVDVDETAAGVSRDEIVALLSSEGVNARRYFHPGCPRMAPYSPARSARAARRCRSPSVWRAV